MGKSLPVSAFKKLARLIASTWAVAVLGPARSRTLCPQIAPAGPCALNGSTSEPTQEQIERRSYELWQQAGFPKGRDEELEERAEKELREEKSRPLKSRTRRHEQELSDLPRHRMGVRRRAGLHLRKAYRAPATTAAS